MQNTRQQSAGTANHGVLGRFSGGIGRSYNEGTCGALSAGIMALGIYLPDENEKTIALSKELFDHFKQENGTVICGNIVQKHGFSRCTGCCLCYGNKVAELLQREKAQFGTVQMFRRNGRINK